MEIVVAISMTEAKYVVHIEASKEIIWLQRFMDELGKNQEICMLYSDCHSS